MRLAPQRDRVGGVPEKSRGRRPAGIDRGLVQCGVAVKARIQVTAIRKQPRLELALHAKRILSLHMAEMFVRLHEAVGRRQNHEVLRVRRRGVQMKKLNARIVFEMPSEPVINQVELHDVRFFVDLFGRGINVPRVWSEPVGIAPFEHRLRAVPELVFVTEHHLRPVRERETEINPRVAEHQLQIAIQIKR